MDDATQNMLRTFRDVLVESHRLFKTPVKPEIAAMKVSDMYVQMLIGSLQANAVKEMGPGIRLDFAKFAGVGQ